MSKCRATFIIALMVFNMVIFLLSSVINNFEVGIGSGLGLFALFTMIRYRSEPLPIIEMSYLLIAVCFGFVNAIYPNILAFSQIAILEVLILAFLTLTVWKFQAPKLGNLRKQKVRYEQLELLKPQNITTLTKDLESRLGIQIHSIDIENINFSENFANLAIFSESQSEKYSGNKSTWSLANPSQEENHLHKAS